MTKNLSIKKSHILHWEDAEEYENLFASLSNEHDPQGATEHHLVEELASIIWRKHRVGVAENALHQYGLDETTTSYSQTVNRSLVHLETDNDKFSSAEAIKMSKAKHSEEISDAKSDLELTEMALELTASGNYEEALSALREDTRGWWEDVLEEGEDGLGTKRFKNAKSLSEWLKQEAIPFIEQSLQQFDQIPLIRQQAYGESLNPQKLNELAKWEAHLDRKFERTLTMLLKLREIRCHKG